MHQHTSDDQASPDHPPSPPDQPSAAPPPAPEAVPPTAPHQPWPRRLRLFLGQQDVQRVALAVEFIGLAIATLALGFAAAQLYQAARDGRETNSALGRIISILSEDLDLNRRQATIQAATPASDPAATQNAIELLNIQATRDALLAERDFILRSLNPTPTPACRQLSINITEVMAVPYPPNDDPDIDRWNEYVELYNHGTEDLDLGGWWLADRGGHPGQIVDWNSRFQGLPVGDAITDSTVLPPSGFAVILPAAYDSGNRPYDEEIASGARILTLLNRDYIGDGLVGTDPKTVDVLALYTGTDRLVNCLVSTYGTPLLPLEGFPPTQVTDNAQDDIPMTIDEGWGGFYRIFMNGADASSNWRRFPLDARTPGYALPDQPN